MHDITSQSRRSPASVAGLAAAALLMSGFAASGSANADEPPIYDGIVSGVALGGYDPVAYFRQGQPVEGRAEFSLEWQGAEWRFASGENRAFFARDPEAYAPQYGGYCAWAVAENYTAHGDPQHWNIVDGRLYLNFNARIQRRWERDIPGYISSADANWPGVLSD